MLIGHQGGRGGSLYDLYAVVHHLGALSSGHYVASVKSPSASKWHYFNDNQVLRTASITREPLAIWLRHRPPIVHISPIFSLPRVDRNACGS